MLPDETYNAVCNSLKAAADVMGAHGNSELLKDEEDVVIYKRLLQLAKRVVKQRKKAQKAKIHTEQP